MTTIGNPFVLNDLEKEQMLKDRRTVYDTLVSQGDDDYDGGDGGDGGDDAYSMMMRRRVMMMIMMMMNW